MPLGPVDLTSAALTDDDIPAGSTGTVVCAGHSSPGKVICICVSALLRGPLYSCTLYMYLAAGHPACLLITGYVQVLFPAGVFEIPNTQIRRPGPHLAGSPPGGSRGGSPAMSPLAIDPDVYLLALSSSKTTSADTAGMTQAEPEPESALPPAGMRGQPPATRGLTIDSALVTTLFSGDTQETAGMAGAESEQSRSMRRLSLLSGVAEAPWNSIP
jgi:hypothetical protein